MIRSLLMVDGFFRDPYSVRQTAIEAEYVDIRGFNYPGFQSVHPFVSSSVISQFEQILGGAISFDQAKGAFGRFRYMPASMETGLRVHLDGVVGWTGVVYLNTDDQCRGGTVFYKHRRTGLFGAPSQSELDSLGYRSYQEFEAEIVVPDSVNESAWEETSFVAMRFNRLILFRGNELFHSHAFGFGNQVHDSRLTQNFFFDNSTDVTPPP